jgi:hypothetical protein
MKQVVNFGTVLFKLQSSFGTMETPLTTTDYLQGGKQEFQMENPVTEVDTIGAIFGQDSPVTGSTEGSYSVTFPLRTGGAQDSPGAWTKPMQCCGFKETEVTNVYTYALTTSDNWKDATIQGFTGAAGASNSLRRILYNVLCNAKFNLDFSTGYGSVEFSGKGVFAGDTSAQTTPAVTRDSLLKTPSLIGGVSTIFADSAVDLIAMTADLGNEVSVCEKPTASDGSGKGMSLLTKTNVKYTFTYYVDSTQTFKPHALVKSGTTVAFSVAWGTAPNKITMADSYVRITNVKESEKNGVLTYEVSAVSVGNGFTISADTSA